MDYCERMLCFYAAAGRAFKSRKRRVERYMAVAVLGRPVMTQEDRRNAVRAIQLVEKINERIQACDDAVNYYSEMSATCER